MTQELANAVALKTEVFSAVERKLYERVLKAARAFQETVKYEGNEPVSDGNPVLKAVTCQEIDQFYQTLQGAGHRLPPIDKVHDQIMETALAELAEEAEMESLDRRIRERAAQFIMSVEDFGKVLAGRPPAAILLEHNTRDEALAVLQQLGVPHQEVLAKRDDLLKLAQAIQDGTQAYVSFIDLKGADTQTLSTLFYVIDRTNGQHAPPVILVGKRSILPSPLYNRMIHLMVAEANA